MKGGSQRTADGVGDNIGGACNVGHEQCVVDEEISTTVMHDPTDNKIVTNSGILAGFQGRKDSWRKRVEVWAQRLDACPPYQATRTPVTPSVRSAMETCAPRHFN